MYGPNFMPFPEDKYSYLKPTLSQKCWLERKKKKRLKLGDPDLRTAAKTGTPTIESTRNSRFGDVNLKFTAQSH